MYEKQLAMLLTAIVFILLSIVLTFIGWLWFDAFKWIAAVIAVYGYVSMINDFNSFISIDRNKFFTLKKKEGKH